MHAGSRMLGGLVVGLWLASGTAAQSAPPTPTGSSHDVQPLREARTAFDDARFADARASVDRLLDARRLDWDTVVVALELRALASFALDDAEGLEVSLRRLAVLEPNRTLPPETPPVVRERWDAVREVVAPFDARFELRREGDDVVGVVIANDLEGLVRGYRARLVGGGERVEADGLRVGASTPRGGRFELSVSALGPGGIVLAERRHVGDVTSAAVIAGPAPSERGNRRARRAVVAVSVVVVVAMAVGVGLSFALRDDAGGAVLVGPQP